MTLEHETERWTGSREPSFTVNEVEAILRRALTRKRDSGEITRSELIDTGRELGLDSREIERAIDEQMRVGDIESAQDEFKREKKARFHRHLHAYLIVNTALFLISLLDGDTWFMYPLIGWGIALAFHASGAFNPSTHDLERGTRRVLKKRQRQQQRQY